MNCDDVKELLPDHLRGDLAPEVSAAVGAHLASCAQCAREVRELTALWEGLGELEDHLPSPAVEARFRSMLADAIDREAARSLPGSSAGRVLSFERERAPERRFREMTVALAAAAMLVVGVLLGFFLGRGGRSDAEVAVMRDEVRSLRGLVAVSMLANASASERLQGVSYGRGLLGDDPKVTEALLKALDADPNESVRLAAIDALAPLATRTNGRARLMEAAARQRSPSVTLSLVDLLLASGATAAELEPLSRNTDLDPTVRSYVRARLGGRT